MKVEFQGIKKSYGSFQAVHGLDLVIESGALHFLLGPSGCGKTTTLRMLAGLEKPSAGRIVFGDRDVTQLPAARRGIGMVFQNYALWPHMTVRKNIEYGLQLKKLGKPEISARIERVLDMTQLTRFAERLPGQLSGGQQQRVALARALAVEPAVLLLDEPLSNLDAKLRHEMRDSIVGIHEKTGITMVYVTHDQKEALSMASSISIMHGGHLIQSGAPREIYARPQSAFVAGFIGETNIVEGGLSQAAEGCRLDTGIGELRAWLLPPALHGQPRVKASIRPEALQIVDDAHQAPLGGAGHSLLKGTVNRMTYLGESEQLLVRVGSQDLKVNLFNVGGHVHKPGSKVTLAVRAEDVVVLPVDDGIGLGT